MTTWREIERVVIITPSTDRGVHLLAQCRVQVYVERFIQGGAFAWLRERGCARC